MSEDAFSPGTRAARSGFIFTSLIPAVLVFGLAAAADAPERRAGVTLRAVGGGSFATRGKTHAIAVYVNSVNPLAALSWADLHRVFAGGTALTWGELGLEGAWRSAPVRVYGMPNLRETGNPPGIVNYLRRMINAGAPLADDIRQLAGDEQRHALQQIVDAVAADRFGIAYSGFGFGTEGARSIPLALTDEAVPGSPESIAGFDYLLTRSIYIAIAPDLDSGRRRAAFDFVTLALDPAGQRCITNDPSGFTPLPDAVLARQRDRIAYRAQAGTSGRGAPAASYVTGDGKVRIVGYNDMRPMLARLNRHFRKSNPAVDFELVLEGTPTAPPALADGSSLLAPMGAEFSDAARTAFRKKVGHDPVPVRVAHASLSPKALSASDDGGLAYFITRENVIDGRYPLGRFLYIYLREPPHPDRDPLLHDYLQMVLSPAGQAIVAAGDREYLPLSAAALITERQKLLGYGMPRP